jgi:AmmeMemoRadiSam system protein B
LDDALLLDSPRYLSLFESPARKPSCIGCYSDVPKELAEQLDHLFTAPEGPGLPGKRQSTRKQLRAVLLPHMDYGRGNITYGFGFKELIENSRASVFVIIGTSHYSPHRFNITRQHFETPLGVVVTDQEYVNRIVTRYGDGLFDDPAAHIPEHSIELEVVPLQHLMQQRPFRIVPLLVGSFHDCIRKKTDPIDTEDIGRMVTALREAETACPDEVCYLISGDLAHIGPKFSDQKKACEPWLSASRSQDEKILNSLTAANPTTYFETIADEGDARRICGLSPTWLTLTTAQPRCGQVLHYQQFVDPSGHESVSFAAAAFYS